MAEWHVHTCKKCGMEYTCIGIECENQLLDDTHYTSTKCWPRELLEQLEKGDF